MECNKDEAVRAKEIAEKKLMEKDLDGAKKFALKAQNLFPGLEGLPQFMAIIDIHVAADKKINGEADWYGILGVDPLADDGTMRKQYRSMALMLQPDKNKSVGAEGAFKILVEAWSVLSDKDKRVLYNEKRNLRNMNPKTTTRMPGRNSFCTPQPTPIPPHPAKPNTFWTACNQCKMQYKYLRDYVNQNLCCPCCKEPFHAVEMPAPPQNGRSFSTPQRSCQQHPNLNLHFSSNTFSRAGSIRNVPRPGTTAGQHASLFHPSSQHLNRGGEEAQMAAVGEEAARRKRRASQKMCAMSASQAGSSSEKAKNTTKVDAVDGTGKVNNDFHLEESGRGTAQKQLIEHFEHVYTRHKERKVRNDLHLEQSGRGIAQNRLIEHFEHVYTRRKERKEIQGRSDDEKCQ